jgi:hypothetical protein
VPNTEESDFSIVFTRTDTATLDACCNHAIDWENAARLALDDLKLGKVLSTQKGIRGDTDCYCGFVQVSVSLQRDDPTNELRIAEG